MSQDLRAAIRSLRQSPAFTLTAIAALSLGIGFNGIIFSSVNGVMLHPPGIEEPSRVVGVEVFFPRMNRGWGMSAPDFTDLAERREVFAAAALAGWRSFNYLPQGGGTPIRLAATTVTHQYLAVFGARPLLGRGFDAAHDKAGNHLAAVLSYATWQRLFGGDRNVIGRRLALDHESYEVIGVMPEEFRFPASANLWVPANIEPLWFEQKHRLTTSHVMYARLQPGVTLEQADTAVRTIGERGLTPELRAITGPGGRVLRARSFARIELGVNGLALSALSGAVLMVFLVACANVAGLMMARGAARARETAVRAALGAGRWRLMRQALVESVLIGMGGALGGIAVAYASLRAMVALAPAEMYPERILGMDGWFVAFVFGLGLSAAAVFGLLPAWQASALGRYEALKEGGRSGSAGIARQRLRSVLVVAEVALALVLLVGAGMFIQSFSNAVRVDPGFDRAGLTVAASRMAGLAPGNKEGGRNVVNQRAIVERLRAIPGVTNAAASLTLPLSGGDGGAEIQIVGRETPPGTPPHRAGLVFVGSGYFATLGVKLLHGREFELADEARGELIAVVDESFARRYFAGQDAIGASVRQGSRRTARIVGVVSDVRQAAAMVAEYTPAMYLPIESLAPRDVFYLLRTRPGAYGAALSASIREAVQAVDPSQAVHSIRPMLSVTDPRIVVQQFAMGLLSLFAAVALFLAALGLYGVISYSVSQRRQEIGIRMALGALPGQVQTLVISQGMRLTLLGAAIGLAGAIAVSRALAGQLYQVRQFDPVTFGLTAAALGGAALLATWLPSRRAATVDPLVALRND